MVEIVNSTQQVNQEVNLEANQAALEKKEFKLPPVRSMTRAEVRRFRDEGFDPVKNPEIGPEAFEWIIENVYKLYNFPDDMPYSMLIWLARQTYLATFALPYEEEYPAAKNS